MSERQVKRRIGKVFYGIKRGGRAHKGTEDCGKREKIQQPKPGADTCHKKSGGQELCRNGLVAAMLCCHKQSIHFRFLFGYEYPYQSIKAEQECQKG